MHGALAVPRAFNSVTARIYSALPQPLHRHVLQADNNQVHTQNNDHDKNQCNKNNLPDDHKCYLLISTAALQSDLRQRQVFILKYS